MNDLVHVVEFTKEVFDMAPRTQMLNEYFDLLPVGQQELVLALVENLLPDDVASPEDDRAHEQAMEDYRNGECLSFDEAMKELGLA